MIKIWKSEASGRLVSLDRAQSGCWISVTEPNLKETQILEEEYGVLPEFLSSALDPEETSHIDPNEEAGQTLIIADYCIEKPAENPDTLACFTKPLSFVFQKDRLITISIDENPFIERVEAGKFRNIQTGDPVMFFLQMMFAISQKYQLYLRRIEACSERISNRLYQNMNNEGLAEMMELDKSLIYFSASLKADANTLQKIRSGKVLPLSPGAREMLDDVEIEYEQSSDMCAIYTSINERVSNGCNSMISNNMNDIMKKLTVITIVMSIPNMIYGFYGMNVTDLPLPYVWFPLFLSIVCCIICWVYFRNNSRYR